MRTRTKRFKPSVARLEERALLSAITPSASQVKIVPVIQYEKVVESVLVKGKLTVETVSVPETVYVGEIVVTTLADDPTNPIRGQTTLRDAITLADANANNVNQYAITFDVKGTIKLAQALPDLTDTISIVGPGVTIQQTAWFGVSNNTQEPLSVLTVDAGAVVSLSGMSLTVAPGLDPFGVGSSIYNDGLLTMASTAFANGCVNDAQGVLTVNTSSCTSIVNYVGGVATISHSTFNGSGISNYGTMTVIGSTFTHNTSEAILNNNDAVLTIVNSIFADNCNAGTSGGAIWNDGTSTIIGSTFINNTAAVGGAICNYGTMVIQQSVFLGNSASNGGAVFVAIGDVSISSGVFVDNSAVLGGGVYYMDYANVTFNGCMFFHNAGGNIVYQQGGGCFVAGTPVKTEHGFRPIEEIKAGDKVYAYDHATETWVLANVLKPLAHNYYIDDFSTIRLWTPIGSDTIKATGNHPFWVTSGENLDGRPAATDLSLLEQAMTPKGRWVEARNLRIGDTLLRSDNSIATIDDLRSSIEQSTVYNLEMETIHSYTVGSASVLVHNAPSK